MGDDPGQPGRPRPVAVDRIRRARLPRPARGPARRDARRLRARTGHRTRPADPRPRPGQPAAHAARRGGPAHRRRADARRPHPLVARIRHRDRGGREADPADLHPVPAAHPQVPAGRHGHRGVRGHGGARLCDPAARLGHLLGARAVPEGQPDRVPRHPGQPVAARHRDPAGRQRFLGHGALDRGGGAGRDRRADRRGAAVPGASAGTRHAGLRAHRPAGLAAELGPPLGLGGAGDRAAGPSGRGRGFPPGPGRLVGGRGRPVPACSPAGRSSGTSPRPG